MAFAIYSDWPPSTGHNHCPSRIEEDTLSLRHKITKLNPFKLGRFGKIFVGDAESVQKELSAAACSRISNDLLENRPGQTFCPSVDSVQCH